VREIDLGFDFVFAGAVTGAGGGPRGTCGSIGAATKVFAHQVGFVVFQRTGVCFFLGDAHRGQDVKDFPALDFQLTGQIIDSNLTHPLSFPLLITYLVCLGSHV
jgi:hypothetical protein